MSKMPINIIMTRIKDAPLDSKIAVFKTGSEMLEAVFDSTIETRRLARIDTNYLGSFWKGDDMPAVRRLLRSVV